jgi:c-di-GMP-binding flagellar brake protein YcgR
MEPSIEPRKEIQEGEYCLLRVMHRHFWVRVIDIDEDGIQLSFPGSDYPIPGMTVEIELHEEDGYTAYPAEVVKGPGETGDGVVVRCLGDGHFIFHRGSVRVTTDLTAQVRDTVHIRQHSAALLNVSGGGALLRTSAPFELGTMVELNLSFPREPRQLIMGTIVHVSDVPQADNQWLFGVNFNGLDPSSHRMIGRFVYERLQETQPEL